MAKQGSSNLKNLINEILDLGKIESGKMELEEQPFEIESALETTCDLFSVKAYEKGLGLYCKIDKSVPSIAVGDVTRLKQVILNLINNAIKFTHQGEVILSVKQIDSSNNDITLQFDISDSGIGIPKEKQETIWEAFSQASNTTNRLYGGTGLGLPIVKKIVTVMGGHVKIDSLLNKGSRFYFKIDVKIASKQELQKSTSKKEHNFEGKTILLVEDNLINVMVAKQILEKAKLKVAVANNGLQAVEMVKNNKYDAVLMDIQMPIMDGYTASVEIRKFNKNIPILALSASVFMEVKDKINESGMNGFIFKPFEPKDLLNRLEEVVNN